MRVGACQTGRKFLRLIKRKFAAPNNGTRHHGAIAAHRFMPPQRPIGGRILVRYGHLLRSAAAARARAATAIRKRIKPAL